LRRDFEKAASHLFAIATDPEQPTRDRLTALDLLGKYGLGTANTFNVSTDADFLPPLRIEVTAVPAGMATPRRIGMDVPRLPSTRVSEAEPVVSVEADQEGDADADGGQHRHLDPEPTEPAVEVGKIEVRDRQPDGSATIDPPELDEAEPRYFYGSHGIRDLNSRPSGGSYSERPLGR
jgi:hypothetical protein